jgi:hypothetical protein
MAGPGTDLITRIQFALDAATQRAANAAIDATKAKLGETAAAAQTAQVASGGLVTAFGGLRTTLIGLVGAGITKLLTTGLAAEASTIGKSAEAIGMTAEAYQVWAQAAKTAGVEGEAFQSVIGKIGRKAQDASKGGAEAAAAFRSLGVDVKGTAGKVLGTEELLGRVADAFQRMPAGPARSAAAMKLFEESGIKLLPFLSKGSKGIAELRAQMIRSGAIIGDGTIGMARKFTAAKNQFMISVNGVKNTIGSILLPYLTRGMAAISKWLMAPGRLAQVLSVLRAAAIGAAAYLGYLVIPKVLAFFAAMATSAGIVALSLLGLLLVADDLWAFWQGRDSLVGRILDEGQQAALLSFLNGIHTVITWLTDLSKWPGRIRQAWQDFLNWFNAPYDQKGGFLTWLLNSLKMVLRAVDWLAEGLGKVFAWIAEKIGLEENTDQLEGVSITDLQARKIVTQPPTTEEQLIQAANTALVSENMALDESKLMRRQVPGMGITATQLGTVTTPGPEFWNGELTRVGPGGVQRTEQTVNAKVDAGITIVANTNASPAEIGRIAVEKAKEVLGDAVTDAYWSIRDPAAEYGP